ncbi:MAG: sigma-70 family RNA polymerase sigma factor [Gammaproteobacteria bacterium]|nr:sigma-70 family RNA polymerase sigma factor [Gammaproteobacteria bacterium]
MNTSTLSTSIENIDEEQFIKQFTPLVKRIAEHIRTKLPACVPMDDLIQAGIAGLIDAIKRYKGSYDHQFEAFAAYCIRGSILNQLRVSN